MRQAEGIRRIEEAQARCDRLDRMLEEAIPGWSLAPLVEALQALRGIGLVIAATLVAEVADLRRGPAGTLILPRRRRHGSTRSNASLPT
ncbi:hypothetical protein I6F26_32855 [Ensifer sp. IC3342]|nr:hypothetical protein [Ensifer sp. BRP08]MCA1451225.1 hypothetical protein [Ensifer sp. IC3342]